MGTIPEEAGKVATGVLDSLKGTPVIIGLLVVIAIFLGFATYLLGEVAANARERNKSQLEMISKLVSDIRDCRQGAAR